jgi:carbonic anhydrase
MRGVLSRTLVSLLFLAASPVFADEAGPAWSYKGPTGPAHWASLGPDFEVCKAGKFQSPIDVRGAKMTALPPIEFSYQPSPLHILNNGHTIQVNVPPGSSITVGGTRYELVQFHFHHPSESKLSGQAFPLEVHLVHADANGKLAVVGVVMAEGKENPALAALWKYIPTEKGKESAPDGATVDPAALLPVNRAYFTFPGSLTTPPCSEGVTWFLLRTPLRVSKKEVASFSAVYPDNSRPVQPLNGRAVQMSK